MINLNDERFQQKLLATEDNVLNYISDYDIFRHYLPEFKLNSVISSPFRKDNHPSFAVYISDRYNDRILYKDLRTGEKGGAITFVQNKLNLSYREALEQIVIDFNLSNKFHLRHNLSKSGPRPPVTHKVDLKQLKKTIDLNIKSRVWKPWDIEYWNSYGVSLDTLNKYKVKPLQYIFINNKIFKADKLAYAYTEFKNNLTRFKIYQPENDYLKWINNFLPNTLSGYTQLPEESELLFIASSLKDGMCLHDLGYNFIAPQTENYTFKQSLINELKSRFNQIITFYDFDDAGINAAKKLEEQFGLPYINTGNMLKDISDYYLINGRDTCIKLIEYERNIL
jgi:hypothetical protein